jgi:hypothetical protein
MTADAMLLPADLLLSYAAGRGATTLCRGPMNAPGLVFAAVTVWSATVAHALRTVHRVHTGSILYRPRARTPAVRDCRAAVTSRRPENSPCP